MFIHKKKTNLRRKQKKRTAKKDTAKKRTANKRTAKKDTAKKRTANKCTRTRTFKQKTRRTKKYTYKGAYNGGAQVFPEPNSKSASPKVQVQAQQVQAPKMPAQQIKQIPQIQQVKAEQIQQAKKEKMQRAKAAQERISAAQEKARTAQMNAAKAKKNTPKRITSSDKATPRTKMRLERKLTEQLGVMTCKQIRDHLDETTQLSEEEKIKFIEHNINSGKGLTAWIQKQHFGLKDLKYYSEAGKGLLNGMANKTYETYSVMFDASDMKDSDCVFLREKVDKYYKQKEIDETSHWKRAFNMTKNATKAVASYAWSAAKYAWTPAMAAFTWIGATGFRLWTWISRDPKAAYFALVLLKQLKNQLCRYLGKSLGTYNVANNTKESMEAQIKRLKPEFVADPSSSFDDVKTILYDTMRPMKDKLMVKASGLALAGLFDVGTPLLIGGAKLAVTGAVAFVAGPAIAGMVGEGVGNLLGSVFNGLKEDTADAIAQAGFMTDANNCFRMLFEVVDPFNCYLEIMKEANAVFMTTMKDTPPAKLSEADTIKILETFQEDASKTERR
jgi:hypothetical protein